MSTKAVQGKLWSVAPQNWSAYFEPSFLPMYREALKQLNIKDNTTLLDAGCGSGLFSSIAIKAGAQVSGIDAAPGLLQVARLRNPRNNFMEADLETMPFTVDRFDVVAGFNSFQYAGNFENALAEAKRVLKPGGKLVIGIWDKPEMSDATNILKAIGYLLPPPPAGTPGPFALSEDGRIEGICNKIGLKVVHTAKVPCPALFRSLGEGVNCFMSTGPAAAAMNHNDRQVVEDTVAKAFAPYHIADNMHYLHNQFLLFIAEK
ncbi:class I SAM-dependent methyltransferase [Mucilaginibacter sp. HMF5004]|uniref:class I SAM-dependent methyltransferase n=1 Tax=Mucilaginibacter rivuli TaxID=2857527 RepID=UPI001C5E9C81|nr:class I SAM-dependent methyltransferase [Mucilaginibacter rivuli]MBW4891714.1 class I SAM-dependent methyltransferase [Mucilaginibacter rivuli]